MIAVAAVVYAGFKPLPKTITSKMTKRELDKYAKLRKELDHLVKVMKRAQQKASIYADKVARMKVLPTQAQLIRAGKLVDAGMKAEYYAFKKSDELIAFTKKMRAK